MSATDLTPTPSRVRAAVDSAAGADHRRTYATDADRYDRLVRAEDADGALAGALRRMLPAPRVDVVDVGAGTGRIGRILGDVVRLGVGVEPSPAMLDLATSAADEDAARARRVWTYVQGDARALPVRDGRFDVAISAWVLGHLREWYPESWPAELDAALREMRRALRPGGLLVVIDTLGTGTTVPAAPTPALAEYHAWLETAGGLSRDVVRTDYRFDSAAEAIALMGAFFGPSFAAQVVDAGTAQVPECTGIWTNRRSLVC